MMLVPVNESWSTYPANQLTKHDVMTMINDEEVRMLYPLIFFYSTILIIGVIGNALVLLVYSFRYKHSPARVYILFLASIDFSICVFGLPYHMIDLTHPYTYTNSVACKTLTFIIVTLFFMSVFGLIVVAFDRYLKICHPLSRMQIAYFGKKRACGTAVICAFLFSWPNLILYGRSEMGMETEIANVTGHACYFETQYLETNYPFIYTVTLLCICVGATVFLIIAYSCICHRIYMRYNGCKTHSWDDTGMTEEVSQSIIFPLKKVRPVHQNNSKVSSRKHSLQDILQRNENNFNENYKMNMIKKSTSRSDNQLEINSCVKESAKQLRDEANETSENLVPISIVSASDSSEDEGEDNAKYSKLSSADSHATMETPLTTQTDQLCVASDTVISTTETPRTTQTDQLCVASETVFGPRMTQTDQLCVAGDTVISTTETPHTTQTDQLCVASNTMFGGKSTGNNNVEGTSVKPHCNSSDKLQCNSSDRLHEYTGNSSVQSSPHGSFSSISRSAPYIPEQLSKQVLPEQLSKHVQQRMLQKMIVPPEKRLSLPNRDGFPMMQPQTLRKRSSDGSVSGIKQSKYSRARSLPSSTTSSINNIPDGLRINCYNIKAARSSETMCKQNKLRTRPHSKITKIMFTITLLFILSFTPVLIVTFWTIINPGLWDVLEPYQTALLEFALRFYLVNNICNPFIYGFWDRRFLREIVISLRKLYRLTIGKCVT